MSAKPRLAADFRDALDACGYPWDLVQGKKHLQVRVAGRLVCCLPNSGSATQRSASKQMVHHNLRDLRRVLREMKA